MKKGRIEPLMVLLLAFFPESFENYLVQAGLLTYPISVPSRYYTVALEFRNTWGLTAAGTVQDLHLIPFSTCMFGYKQVTYTAGK